MIRIAGFQLFGKANARQDNFETAVLLDPQKPFNFFQQVAKEKMRLMRVALILWLASQLVVTWGRGDAQGVESNRTGIITAVGLNLRAAPDLTAKSLKILGKDEKVEVIEDQGDWLKVSSESVTGYIRNREIYVRFPASQTQSDADRVADISLKERKDGVSKTQPKDIGREIEKHQAEVLAFTRQETRLIESLDQIDLSIDTHRKRMAAFKTELKSIEDKIKKNQQLSQDLKKEIDASERYISKRLVAMYKLNWFGRIHILASAESMYDLFQRKAGLERILSYDEKFRQGMISNKERLEKVLTELQNQKRDKIVVEAKHRKQLNIMTREKGRKEKLLAHIRSKKSLELAAIELLKEASRELDLKINTLQIEKEKPQKAKKTTETPFIQLKGLLNMPVKGKVITHFGRFRNTRFNVSNFRSGIDIRTDRGEPIYAVSGGRILYASWFKGYGNMIIIDHGQHYYTVYAHIEEVFKAKGDPVDPQEVIATVGDSGSLEGPGLYFEVRHRGKPLDPIDWLRKG